MSEIPDPELVARLEHAIGNLPKRQREIFVAHRRDDLTYGEIARRDRLTVRQVERHMARALYKIAKQLDGHKLNWCERLF